jgi:hypothetical protein
MEDAPPLRAKVTGRTRRLITGLIDMIPRVTLGLSAVLIAACIPACADGEVRVVGENLVTNGDFEAGEGEGWSSALQIVDEGTYAGDYAGMFENPEGSRATAVVQSFVPIQPFAYYEFSMAARRETGEGYVYVHCNWYAAPGERLMSSPPWPAGRAEPVTLRTGEGVGDWREYSGIFRSTRADAGGVQLVIFVRDGADTVYLDDISIRKVEYPEAPEWRFPEAVTFPGHPSRFGMSVEGVQQDGQRFTVTTTGAEYVLDAEAGTMSCRQRIGAEREVAVADFGGPPGELHIAQRDEEVCVLEGEDLAFGFQGDSLVTIATNRPLSATVTSGIGAEWFRVQEPHLLAIDEQGGFCVNPWARPKLRSSGTTMQPPEADTGEPGWAVSWEVGEREMFAMAVFPGRHFDWEESFDKRIVGTGGGVIPKEALEAYSEYASVHFMFGHIYDDWAGKNTHAPYNIADYDALVEIIQHARDVDMTSIIYRHPTSYGWVGLDLDFFLEDLRVWRDRLNLEGWYFDGYPGWSDWMLAYQAMRIVRDRVGDATIYVHCTLNPPARMTEIYCPFIDSYATFLLRAEAQVIHGPSDPYLRYVVNAQHISNSIATLKGNNMLVEPLPEDYTREDVENAEKASLKLQLQTMLSLNGRCRWAYPGWPLNDSDHEVYIDYYFAELGRMEQQWRETGEPIPMTWPLEVGE